MVRRFETRAARSGAFPGPAPAGREAAALGACAEAALGWLADAVAVLGPGGELLHVNDRMESLLARAEGLRVSGGALEFVAPEARAMLVSLLPGAADEAPAAGDFVVPRAAGPPLVAALRPACGVPERETPARSGLAILFLRDPSAPRPLASVALRQHFGLTEAELGLARALCDGWPLIDYARERGLSVNTVYTHLRRLKEKTGTRRMPDLIHRLGTFEVAVREAGAAALPQT